MYHDHRTFCNYRISSYLSLNVWPDKLQFNRKWMSREKSLNESDSIVCNKLLVKTYDLILPYVQRNKYNK